MKHLVIVDAVLWVVYFAAKVLFGALSKLPFIGVVFKFVALGAGIVGFLAKILLIVTVLALLAKFLAKMGKKSILKAEKKAVTGAQVVSNECEGQIDDSNRTDKMDLF